MSELTESMTGWLAEHGIPEWLIPFLVSILPIIELRGGIIAARLLDIELFKAIWVCMLGNILPIPFILLFIDKVFDFLKKHKVPLLSKMVIFLEGKAMNKSSTMEKGEFIFLLFFVGIPLPGTGAWTGSLIASLRKIPLKKAVPAIFLGLCLASAIMCTLCYGFTSVFEKMFG
ncbi:MAG: small multi-drug export protein [Ruminococcus sp.]|nr:small multi-drug export protein [Ruminococcus sp.]